MLNNDNDAQATQNMLAEVYEEFEPLMFRYALYMMKNTEDAEDAVHNAFEAIIKHKEKIFPPEKIFSLTCRDLRARIVIIVKSKCIDLLRKRNKIIFEHLDGLEHVLLSEEKTVEEQAIINAEHETLLKHIASLDETSRLVLEMRYILGLTYKEIGRELGITEKHVDTKIQRAKMKIRKLAAPDQNTK